MIKVTITADDKRELRMSTLLTRFANSLHNTEYIAVKIDHIHGILEIERAKTIALPSKEAIMNKEEEQKIYNEYKSAKEVVFRKYKKDLIDVIYKGMKALAERRPFS